MMNHTTRQKMGVAASAILAGLMGASAVVVPSVVMLSQPMVAMAADGTTDDTKDSTKGTVTINSTNANARYEGIQLFTADVDANDNATNIGWATTDSTDTSTYYATKTNILAYINANGYGDWLTKNHPDGDKESPVLASKFISEQIAADANDTGTNTTPATKTGNSFANGLAKYLYENDSGNYGKFDVFQTGTTFTARKGYWVFVPIASDMANTSYVGDDQALSAPIYTTITDTPKTIDEKASAPTLQSSTVKEDSTGKFGSNADADKNQNESFQMVGTLPTSYMSYDMYHYAFNDTMPSGMTLASGDTSSVKVTAYPTGAGITDGGTATATDGVDITSQATVTYKDGKLVVDIPDLKKLTNVTLSKDSQVVVTYDAYLNDKAVIGSAGNVSTTYLTYTHNPIGTSDGNTTKKSTSVYTYKLNVHELDWSSNKALANAKFTLQSTGTADGNAGKYVQADGSIGDAAAEFTTDSNGDASVPAIDEGTYVVHETKVADGYNKVDDLTIAVGRPDDFATATGFTATMTGSTNDMTKVVSTAWDTGTVSAQIADNATVVLPLTGMDAKQATVVYGSAIVVAGAAYCVYRHKKSQEVE